MLNFVSRSAAIISLVFSCTLMAHASPNLARAWGEQAAELHEILAKTSSSELPAALETDLIRFGRIAIRLSKAGTAEHPMPEDLGCIFRGMAEETTVQLEKWHETDDAAAIADAKDRLLAMLKDATIVSQASELAMLGETTELPENLSEGGQCSADKVEFETYSKKAS